MYSPSHFSIILQLFDPSFRRRSPTTQSLLPEPFSNYSISVKAFTRSVEGRESVSVSVTTDVSPPSPPRLGSVSCQPDSALLLSWRRPQYFSGGIDYYLVSYSRSDGEKQGPSTELQVTADTAKEESRVRIVTTL